ncbi:MAG TPA: YifB family Mg chelatase-like AAA ATPase [Candidatus Anaerobutyricum faecale]|nr:YifB family Mg chelatase-like AAA ATPase [Candidatus Anaerobutyricum faecale]
MVAEVLSGMVQGIQGELITVQADISDGLPVFGMTGHLSSEVKEAKERVRTALKNTGYHLPPRRVSVNLAPADVRKSGTCYDLAIAVGILTAMGLISRESVRGILFLGELSLDGMLSPLTGVLSILKAALEAGCRICVIPLFNVKEASLLPGMKVLGFTDLEEVIHFLTGQREEGEMRRKGLSAVPTESVSEKLRYSGMEEDREDERQYPDMSEVKGQRMAKRALEIAVAGCHNLFLDGPPGAGKSMLAACAPGIMPEMTDEERIDTAMIYSVRGMLRDGSVPAIRRPFRAPSSSVTMAGMFGGGSNPRPGEVTLAHHGILFLDEFPEFRRELIEMFRTVLEEHRITQIRNGKNVTFPADFILIAAANPCPCGYYPDRRYCRCTPRQISQYQNRLSGPILDRLDLFVRCDRISYAVMTEERCEEPSEVVRERVRQVWEIQRERFPGRTSPFNGRMTPKEVEKYCILDRDSRALLREVFDPMGLTGRSYNKILKVGRTIADLDHSLQIREVHVREALLFRRMAPMAEGMGI